jgi:signal transduction histidine kinase
MMPHERLSVLVVALHEQVGERISTGLDAGSAAREVTFVANLSAARRVIEQSPPAVIFFDEAVLSGAPPLRAVRELCRYAPVVAAVSSESARELAPLVTAGSVDCVPAEADFLELAGALVERRLLSARRLIERVEAGDGDDSGDFGSILRHELNNPLTGILGNAEMLLSRRQRLPEEAVPRLETIADLAVRLRETVRRLSGAWEARHHSEHSA